MFCRKHIDWSIKVDCGPPPKLVRTRWASYLRIIKWYSEQFISVVTAVKSELRTSKTTRDVSLLEELQNEQEIHRRIMLFNESYGHLIEMTTASESRTYSVFDAYHAFSSLTLGDDPLNVKKYFSDR